ncbi:DUF3653 domain-containing protein [Pseudoxanthomonas putridarboris]|uniref:DUF3653 domain-containing protein n=1 Tax=Pseudoxanthomonas putridarboris TaxID=752605 RepID=A0ABU9IZK1_9GAMM
MPQYLTGKFYGFYVAGNYLVSPDGQRMTPERLRGLLWRDELELRRAGYASRRRAENGTQARQYQAKVKVIIVDLADWHSRNVGSLAG